MKNVVYVAVATMIALPLAIMVDKAGVDDAVNRGAQTSADAAHELNVKAHNYKERAK